MKLFSAISIFLIFVSCNSESESEYNDKLIEGVCHCHSDAMIDVHWTLPDSAALRSMTKLIRDSLLKKERPILDLLDDCMVQHGFKKKDVDDFWASAEMMKTFSCDSLFDLYQHYIFRLKHNSN